MWEATLRVALSVGLPAAEAAEASNIATACTGWPPGRSRSFSSVVLAALLGSATLSRANSNAASARTSVAEPLLSYEPDRLFRPAPSGRGEMSGLNLPRSAPRPEGSFRLSSSHSGMSE